MAKKCKKDKTQAALDRCNNAWTIMMVACAIAACYFVFTMESNMDRWMEQCGQKQATSQPVEVKGNEDGN